MKDLILYSYALLTHILPFLALLFLRSRKQPLSRPGAYVLPVLFGFYVTLVFHVTGAGTLWDGLRQDRWFTRINPYPFANDIDPVGYALNVVMLMPFGFFLPLLCPDFRRPGRVVGAGFCFSLLIELSQILSARGTDIDDLILNTLGALLGYLFYTLCARFPLVRSADFRNRELLLWTGAVFLGRFFLCNYLWMVRLLYGF